MSEKCNNCVNLIIEDDMNEIFKEYKQDKDNLIQILNEVQEKYGYIPYKAQELWVPGIVIWEILVESGMDCIQDVL